VNAESGQTIAERLEYLRAELRAERISYGDLAELQSLAEHIPAGDLELLEAAGVAEFSNSETLEEIRQESAYGLANRVADISGPDSSDSPGSAFLARVRDSLLESIDWQTEQGEPFDIDGIHEIADGAVPIYTYPRWQTFVDLGAWQVDIEDYSPDSSDMTDLAGIALYKIASDLCYSLCSDLDIS
jgi:hypothetical protein